MNKLSTPKVKKGAKASGRYYRLKTLSKRMNEPGKSKPREKAAGKSINNDMDTPPSPADLLRSMEQQLRAGITPTLPASSKARADLARSLEGDGKGLASAAAAAAAASSSVIPRVVGRPTDTKSRSSSALRPGAAGALKASSRPPKVSKKRGRPPVDRGDGGVAVAVAGSGGSVWVLVKEWPFAEGQGRGKEQGLEKPPFFKELWMMMAAFGDPRGAVVCRCEAHGKKQCPCMEGVVAIEALVKSFGARVVTVCQEWSGPRRIKLEHLQLAMPGEMREFLAWREAHSTRKNTAEKHAGVQLDDDDDEVDDDAEDDPSGDNTEEEVNNDGKGVPPKGAVDVTGGMIGIPDEGNSGEQEWTVEVEEVAARIEHRRRFADEITALMPEDEYLHTFSEFRRAFFIVGRGKGLKGKDTPGSLGYLADYLGIEKNAEERKDKKLMQALAYMMYDFVGVLVETAIRKRTGGRLVSIASEQMLSAQEIEAAGATVPPLPGRAQRVRVRSVRTSNPDGISHNKPLAGFAVGLEYRGDPLRWPRNKIEKGKVLVEGGEVVDAGDGKLAKEAMEILETDFADC